jgi:hypothetical protein
MKNEKKKGGGETSVEERGGVEKNVSSKITPTTDGVISVSVGHERVFVQSGIKIEQFALLAGWLAELITLLGHDEDITELEK